MNRTTRQKINKIDLKPYYKLCKTNRHGRTLNLTGKYTFFSSVHGTFFQDMMDYKTCLKKFGRIGIMQNMLSDCSRMKLEISNRRKFEKLTNM
jgi:hypothetical protein